MVQAETCSYHSEGLFSRKGLPSSTALEPSGERKKYPSRLGPKHVYRRRELSDGAHVQPVCGPG